jgi:ABC-type dipeptide/oligopeptide/nickel transport system permease subunit
VSADLLPRRGAVVAEVARVVSWPLTLVLVLIGSLLRLLALPLGLLPTSGSPAGVAGSFGRWRAHLVQGARYLSWQSDDLPRAAGPQRAPGESPGPWEEARRRLTRSRTAMVCWIGLAVYLMVGIAAQAGWIAGDYAETQRDKTYEAPAGLGATPALGRDLFGRDVLSMGLRGTATALWIGTFAAVLACVVGSVLGALAGFYGGWIDAVVVWLYTTLESIPELLLVLAFSFVFKVNEGLRDAYNDSFLAETLGIPIGLLSLVIVMGLTFWTGVCRQVRGEFLRQRERDYVLAGRALGLSSRRIAFRHVFPNVFHLVLVSFSLLFIGAIKYEVVLTFLGVGMDAGEASWGRMIEQAKLELLREPSVWWQLGTATALLFGLVLCVNLFADALRDALDPRLRT